MVHDDDVQNGENNSRASGGYDIEICHKTHRCTDHAHVCDVNLEPLNILFPLELFLV